MLRGHLRLGEASAGLGGALLLASLFLPWFDDRTGWEALSVADVLLATVALMGLLLAFLAATQAKPDLPIAGAALAVPVGVLALSLVIYRLLEPVDDLGRDVGLFLALAGSLGLTAGAWGAMRVET